MIGHLLKVLISLFRYYGYPILFVTSFLEGIPILGSIIPGATLAVFGGFLARTHALHFFPLLFIVSLGAYLGDIFSYFIGRHYGYTFLKKYGRFIFLTEARLEYVRKHVKENCAKTLILGRFTVFTRSLAPFAAGASHVDVLPFLGYTLISAVAWAFSHLIIGYIFGKWLEKVSRYLGLIFFLTLVAGIGLVYAYRFINKRHHVFKKFHVYTLVLMIFSLFFFSSTLDGVLENNWLTVFNRPIAHFVQSIQTPSLITLMIFITNFGGALYLSFLTLALVLYLALRKQYYKASIAVSALLIGGILQFGLKDLINIPRPEHSLITTFFSSFPSGHATSAMIFGSFVFLSFVDSIRSKAGKYILFFVTAGGVILVGFSRIYLNAHYTTDVIAGFAVGLFSVTFTILLFRVVVFVKKWLD